MEKLILTEEEIRLLYLACLAQKASKNDIMESHKAQLFHYAEKQQFEAIKFIDELLSTNENFDFEYYVNRSATYKNALAIMDWLTNNNEITHNENTSN
jgi:hypothetical protein